MSKIECGLPSQKTQFDWYPLESSPMVLNAQDCEQDCNCLWPLTLEGRKQCVLGRLHVQKTGTFQDLQESDPMNDGACLSRRTHASLGSTPSSGILPHVRLHRMHDAPALVVLSCNSRKHRNPDTRPTNARHTRPLSRRMDKIRL